MRVSKSVIALDSEGRPSHYRTMTAAVRQYDLVDNTHLAWLVLTGQAYNGTTFDWDIPEDDDG